MYIPVLEYTDPFWCMLLVVVWNGVQQQQWPRQCSQILDLVAVCVCVCVCVYMCVCVHVYVCVIEQCFSLGIVLVKALSHKHHLFKRAINTNSPQVAGKKEVNGIAEAVVINQ